MEGKLLGRALHSMAECDQFDNIGRLFISEAKKETNTPTLSFEQIQQLWRTHYPNEDVDESCGVIRVYFFGKETAQNIRSARAPSKYVICELPADKTDEYKPEQFENPEEFQARQPDKNNVLW